MNVILGAVRDAAAEVLENIHWRERRVVVLLVVVHFAHNEMIFCAFRLD
jgi:hypothetical protein